MVHVERGSHEVREAVGVPIPTGGAGSTVDGGFALDRGVVYLANNDPRMVFSWQGTPDDMSAVVGAAGRSGTVAFRIPATVDEEDPPAVRPPEAAGVMSWQCGSTPARLTTSDADLHSRVAGRPGGALATSYTRE